MSDLVKRLRKQSSLSESEQDELLDRLEQLESVLAQAREALAAVDVLFGPVARDCTQKNWIDNASDAIKAIDEALK